MNDSATGTQTYIGHLYKDDVVSIRPYELEGDLIGDGWTAFSGYELWVLRQMTIYHMISPFM